MSAPDSMTHLTLLREGEFTISGPDALPEAWTGDEKTNLCSETLVWSGAPRVGEVAGERVLYLD